MRAHPNIPPVQTNDVRICLEFTSFHFKRNYFSIYKQLHVSYIVITVNAVIFLSSGENMDFKTVSVSCMDGWMDGCVDARFILTLEVGRISLLFRVLISIHHRSVNDEYKKLKQFHSETLGFCTLPIVLYSTN
jgi:hypothetical protein